MTSQSSTILTAFNDHFMEFVSDIITVFPTDTDILSAKNSFTLIRKANPKMIIKIWHTHVVEKYETVIDNGDISFFINKDYSTDLTNTDNSEKITEAIDRLRNPVKLMTPDEQKKVMKYIQNLKKLSTLYQGLN
jgi:hypothetical protein